MANSHEKELVAERRAKLTPAQRTFLEKRLREGGPKKRQPRPTIRRRSESSWAPLSFSQQRLWFLHQLEPDNVSYTLPFVLRFSGQLDVAALNGALSQIIARHEILRTTITEEDGLPLQRIHPPGPFQLLEIDLSHVATAERDAEVRRLIQVEAHQPFSLTEGPLFRLSLVRLDDRDHVLLFSMHHIISDAWSIGIFVNELSKLYGAMTQETSPDLPDLPLQFGDFAAWQHERLNSEAFRPQLDYWLSRLANPTLLDLPTDRPRPLRQTFAGGFVPFAVPPHVWRGLQRIQQQEGTTLFMTLLAAFQILMHRYSGQDDIIVGSPFAGRIQSELEPLIGFFVNTLVLRSDLSGDPTFLDFLSQVRNSVIEAHTHQEVPFEQLVDRLDVERDLSRSPLFQVMFTLQNAPTRALDLPGLTLTSTDVVSDASRFDLTLYMLESNEGLGGSFEYNTDLFDRVTIERMAGLFQTLLSGIAANPAEHISALPVLSPPQRSQMLVEWNNTVTEYPEEACVYDLIEQQVRKTPDAVALVFQDQQVTYAQLNARACQVAEEISRQVAVGPEKLIGVCVERSIDMVVALLGILKAGAAYVPMDPTYPSKRLAMMLEQADLALILSQSRLISQLPATTAPVICIESIQPRLPVASNTDSVTRAAPDNLCYVIFTSGSTGKPKGVQVTHRNVVNFFTAMDRCLVADGTWLALTSISFDISVLELLWTLARGFRVVVRAQSGTDQDQATPRISNKKIDFSLFYFASDDHQSDGMRYRLLIDGAVFADQQGFTAVWTPERHFHAFGGLYPNPSVTSAAIAVLTKKIAIRAGSVVAPLHNPVRIAEEWSVVDNLSGGRVGVSFASGWHASDFVLAPENYANRKEIMLQAIESVRRLWRGDSITLVNGQGQPVETHVLPRPVQLELPIWLTAAGNPDTFQAAGEIGANLLTHLLGQSLEQLQEKISIYRTAWRKAGHANGTGHVTLMFHAFVGDDMESVRRAVREPFRNYLKSSVSLIQNLAKDFKATDHSTQDLESLLDHAFDRYFETSGLFGTPDTCLAIVERLKEIGVDEVACLIDFGVAYEQVMTSLEKLSLVRQRANRPTPDSFDDSISNEIVRQGVTHLQCTPSMVQLLTLEPTANQALSRIAETLVGGEALSANLADQLAALGAKRIRNMYGPTETTVWSTSYDGRGNGSTVPIGYPIANTNTYVLGRYSEPVPVGVRGELYIGGTGVSRGYLKDPISTAQRFRPDPYALIPGQRAYHTGDNVRYQEGGSIEFLGRADSQVKLRGYRIELGEIETVLREHPAVEDALAIVDGRNGSDRLIAYVRGDAGGMPSELREFLSDRMPQYMIPSAFVPLESFPLTPNGKIDRRALPSPSQEREPHGDYQEPRTDVELVVHSVWSELLQMDRIGIHENFFEIGGHSLLGAQLIARLRSRFSIALPLQKLFESPTIHGLAANIESIKTAVKVSKLPLYCLNYGPSLAKYLDEDYPVHALMFGKEETEGRNDIQSMAEFFVEKLRSLQPAGPYLLGGYCGLGVVAYEMAQQLQAEGEHIAALCLFDVPRLSQPSFRFSQLLLYLPQRTLHHFQQMLRHHPSKWPGYVWGRLKSLVRLFSPERGPDENVEAPEWQRVTQMARSYQPQPYSGPLTIFVSKQFSDQLPRDPSLGWRALAPDSTKLYTISCDHLTMFNEPHIVEVAQHLRELLGGIATSSVAGNGAEAGQVRAAHK